MSTIQERLQLKRVPLDTWNIREQLCLASAVVRSGDQNWMSVSRALKTVGEPNRPADWYSQKSCAAQYGALLEHVETPKRKKRSSEGGVETPQESILKRLTQERIVEIQKNVAELTQQYEQIRAEVTEIRNPSTSEERIAELAAGVEAARRARDRESARRALWLRDREEKRARAERTWRPPVQAAAVDNAPSLTSSPAPAPSSPLLTSLLKSSPVVTTPQHISHPNNMIETLSPSAGAPTLSQLLEAGRAPSTPQKSPQNTPQTPPTPPAAVSGNRDRRAAIEHIKSQLVQIERQFKASSAPQVTPMELDDIEIKAEDVYAFRDVDLPLPPPPLTHKSEEKPQKQDIGSTETAAPPPLPPTTTAAVETVEIKQEDPRPPTPPEVPVSTTEEVRVEPEPVPEPEIQADLEPQPEVRFPTAEIKVVGRVEEKIKEETKEPQSPPPPEIETVEETARNSKEPVEKPPSPQIEEPIPPPAPSPPPVEEAVQHEENVVVEEEEKGGGEGEVESHEQPPQDEPPEKEKEEDVEVKNERENSVEPQRRDEEQTEEEVEVKREEDPEDSLPLKDIIEVSAHKSGEGVEGGEGGEGVVKEEPPTEPEETHTETDDDTPMELSRSEEKEGKTRRDYSRKRKAESLTASGSDTATEAPDSPHTDADRTHRLWKKSVMLVYSRLCAHKYASLFLRPISDEEAPGYSLVVRRPMDLSVIRRHIDSGAIRTTAEFQRDVLLMLSNALMYNSTEHSVYQMAKEMHQEAQSQLTMLLAAQAHAGLVAPPARRKRRRGGDSGGEQGGKRVG